MKAETGYELYLRGRKEHIEKYKDVISKVNNSSVPQNILWIKSVCREIENDEAKCETINDEFYFTEKLVNKLMYLSYLIGVNDGRDVAGSFDDGWNAHREHIMSLLEGNKI